MKTKKKRLGTKAQIAAMKERERRIVSAVFLGLILLVLVFSGWLAYSLLNQPAVQSTQPAWELTAAIVDQLSLTYPNDTFRRTATEILANAGYKVTYYAGELATVDFFRKLPGLGCKLIVLRVHCGHNPDTRTIGFFTSEQYTSAKYVTEQLYDRLQRVAYSSQPDEGEPTYFGITPEFVTYSMEGSFNETTIINMGCYGLEFTCMAQALLEKGAKTYVGWNGMISSTTTDTVTTNLLRQFLVDGKTLNEAVELAARNTSKEEGYDSSLCCYP